MGLRCRDGTVAVVVSAVVETLCLCEASDMQGDATRQGVTKVEHDREGVVVGSMDGSETKLGQLGTGGMSNVGSADPR